MRLDTKYFVPFVIGIAMIGILAIVWSSFRFNSKQLQTFNSELSTQFEAYANQALPVLQQGIWAQGRDSLRFSDLDAEAFLVLFSARWSEKSSDLLAELESKTLESKRLPIIIALVLDTKEGLDSESASGMGFSENTYTEDMTFAPKYTIVDGSQLYNRYQVPGIPTLVFQDSLQILWTHVGFRSADQLSPLDVLLEEFR